MLRLFGTCFANQKQDVDTFYYHMELKGRQHCCKAQVKDRLIVAERMKAHVQAADTTPLLIFPEGTCVNNEYCVMFKRGAFDLGATVCPIAIKYNKIFVDAFWNSKRQSFTAHLVQPPPSLSSRPLQQIIAFYSQQQGCSTHQYDAVLSGVASRSCMLIPSPWATCFGRGRRLDVSRSSCVSACTAQSGGKAQPLHWMVPAQAVRASKVVKTLQKFRVAGVKQGWNARAQGKLMTSWAVVCDVYFLEPQTKLPEENAQQFAERVQKMIAERAKLQVAPWDGYLKYYTLGVKVRWLPLKSRQCLSLHCFCTLVNSDCPCKECDERASRESDCACAPCLAHCARGALSRWSRVHAVDTSAAFHEAVSVGASVCI